MPAQAMTPLNAKVKPEEKELFIQICDSIGTTPSNAVRMFVSAFNRCGGFPFDSSNPRPMGQASSNRAGAASDNPNPLPTTAFGAVTDNHAKANREQVLAVIASVCENFPAIKRAYLFGSMARNTFSNASDVDIRLELDRSQPFNLHDLVQFSKRIEQLTQREVDVVSADDIANKALAKAIEQDKVLAYERKE